MLDQERPREEEEEERQRDDGDLLAVDAGVGSRRREGAEREGLRDQEGEEDEKEVGRGPLQKVVDWWIGLYQTLATPKRPERSHAQYL